MRTFLILAGKEAVSAWIAAAALINAFYVQPIKVVFIEPDAIQKNTSDRASLQEPIVDACLPSLRNFHSLLKVPEREMMNKTNATFSLGVCYKDWSHQGQQFLHAHTPYGSMLEAIDFHQYASMLHQLGDTTGFDAYSLAAQAAHQGRFAFISKEDRQKGLRMDYSMNLDLLLYTKFMRDYAITRAQQNKNLLEIKRGNFFELVIDAESGCAKSIVLESGEKITGDFFLDCTGSDALLASRIPSNETLSESARLPETQRVSFFTNNMQSATKHLDSPFTILSPHAQGWKKIIPLRNKTLHSWTYVNSLSAKDLESSDYLIEKTIKAFNDSTHANNNSIVSDCWVVSSAPKKQKYVWNKNCLALGAAAADFSDLGLSYLHLVQSGILRFIELFPSEANSGLAAEQYNQLTQAEYARIIDFHQLQLLLCQTQTSDFWQEYKQALLSQEVAHKINLFKERGKIAFYEHETWLPPLWIALLLGNNVWPEKYETRLNDFELEKLVAKLNEMKMAYKHYANKLPEHAAFLERYVEV